jgi:hypothetical protein
VGIDDQLFQQRPRHRAGFAVDIAFALMNRRRLFVIAFTVAFGTAIALLAWWFWDAGGMYVCESMFAKYNPASGLCTGGKSAAEGYRVSTGAQLNGALSTAVNLAVVLFLLIIALGSLFAAYWFRASRKTE